MKNNDAIRERILDSKQVFQGHFLKVDRVRVELPDGKPAERDIIRHPGAVAILAVNGDGEILLERQYRTALDEVILEIPAGKVDPGEDRECSARRELEEETGCQAGSWEHLGDVILAAGYCDEKISLYLARDLNFGEQRWDIDEFLDWEFRPRKEVEAMIRDNHIQDSKTIAALYYLALKEQN